MTLNVLTLEEAPCCYKWVDVNDLSLGQVHLMACEPYMLCQSRCSCISFLECPSVFTEALLQGSARLSNSSQITTLGHFEQGIWYTTPVHWSKGAGSLEWTSWRLRVLCGRKATLMSSPHTTPSLTTLTTQNTSTMHSQYMCTFRSSQLTPSVPTERGFCIC